MKLPSRLKHKNPPHTLPKEFIHNVGSLMGKQFKTKLQGSTFLVYGNLYPDEVVVCVSLNHPKSLRAASLHISSELPKKTVEAPDVVTDCLKDMVDVAASWYAQALEKGQGLDSVLEEMGEMKPDWQEIEWEKRTLFVKLNRDNYSLERAADDFLKKAGIDPDESNEEGETEQ